MAVTILRPGSRLGVYPQRLAPPAGALDRLGKHWLARFAALLQKKYQMKRLVARVDRAAAGLDAVDDAALDTLREQVRYDLLRDGLEEVAVLRAFALVREYARRRMQMRHYDVQVYGAWAVVNGNMAEMATGEGKTLTATLAAASAALAGIPVHVITTNEYLAVRDARQMEPLYRDLGLSVTAVRESMNIQDKQAAYRCDIVYCTNKQVAFDYLRDRLVSRKMSGPMALKFSRVQLEGQLVLRGLCFAIVDEADSVLIDEARTPLLLSREHDDPGQQVIAEQSLTLARQMVETEHFLLQRRERSINLTPQGRAWVAEQTGELDGVWTGQRHSEFLVHQALSALHLFQRDVHYLVRDGKIEIIDRNTGRTMEDRSWQRGLHQMIECKEDCKMTGNRETLASISYQRFFQRYLHLGGMSGTLQQVTREMRGVYQQRVIKVPTHRPSRRKYEGFFLHRRADSKWAAILQRVEQLHAGGSPVLVGTGSVHDSELLANMMQEHGLSPRVLNARHDHAEAEIIAGAGQPGRVTIATSMAGRGTDIKLGPGVEKTGGLHVIITDCHEEYRVDRQLMGRCARQGDPGSVETHVSLNDTLIRNFYPTRVRRLFGYLMGDGGAVSGRKAILVIRLPQLCISRQYRLERKRVMQQSEQLSKILAYTGQEE